MHAFKIISTSLSLLAGLAAGATTHCCNNGTEDVKDFCGSQSTLDHKIVAFCCGDTDPNSDTGCDEDINFPTGRAISVAAATTCTSGGQTGFIACSV
ncbi:uncharacterized protein LY79DRAFT_564310 [Colletotrichum navitas]|uniref:Uncharacterized protein n=1 Tax=Colletotrichum navitas TaxID=681940 RepID=A0AAD8V0Q4_9PEZI|nr:uncharacterized protein LY79DRAFT_564310 [Colletotrichum navitas]KAK1579351.1 hypothetical protein LY79DRAFT_564310 [Colletotrichum navitas]